MIDRHSLFPDVSLPDGQMPLHGFHTSTQNLLRMQECPDEATRKQVREEIKSEMGALIRRLGDQAVAQRTELPAFSFRHA